MTNWLRYQWQRYLAWALRDRCPLPTDEASVNPETVATLVEQQQQLDRHEDILRHHQARFNAIEARTQVELRRRQ